MFHTKTKALVGAPVLVAFFATAILISSSENVYGQNIESQEPSTTDQQMIQQGVLPTAAFEIRITVGTQSPWNKRVPLILTVIPNLDSERTEVSWDVPFGVEIIDGNKNFFSASKGKSFERKVYLLPSKSGRYTITANVTNWGYGSNYTSSENITLTFGQDLVTEPETANYTTASIIRYTMILLFAGGGIIGIYFGFKKFKKPIKAWFKPPQ